MKEKLILVTVWEGTQFIMVWEGTDIHHDSECMLQHKVLRAYS